MSRILVIDDDRSVRHLIAKAFEDTDVQFVPAARPRKAAPNRRGSIGCRAVGISVAANRQGSSCSSGSARSILTAGDLYHVAFQ